jgi:electron transport complex protein RnfD
MNRALLAALTPCLLVSAVLFGAWTAVLVCVGAAGAAFGDWLCHSLLRRSGRPAWLHSALIGALLVMILPPTIGWLPAAGGAFVGVVAGKALQGGRSNYLWHPALIGWAFLQLVYPAALAPDGWPVLRRDRLLVGSIEDARAPAAYFGYLRTDSLGDADAWRLRRPIDTLAEYYARGAEGETEESFRATALYELPPFVDTLLGAVGGGIGETSALAILAGGLWLIFRRRLRWQSPACALVAAAMVAAFWPFAGRTLWQWPVLMVEDGFPIGPTVVLYHLTGGGLMLACFFLAADSISTPLTTKGHAIFGAGVGLLTILIRVMGVSPGSCYWAVLAMNTLVPLIDRLTRRRVYGT